MKRSPLDFDISVSASKRKTMRARAASGEISSSRRRCEWDGCEHPGQYRAPHSRERLNEYRWFCLEHVREYNRRWNYYKDMSETEIARSMLADQLWERPTWSLGKQPDFVRAATGPHSDGEVWKRFGMSDPFEVLGEKATINPGSGKAARDARERTLPKLVRRALTVLDLDPFVTRREIRLRYKELVKRFHPDRNGGDRSEEARLQEVIWAWEQLKSCPAFRD